MIETTQCYLIRNGLWLMLLRNKKKNDINEGKWIAPGGKLEAGETIEECAVREVLEETGLYADHLVQRGVVEFHYEDSSSELITVYTCDQFHGELKECEEGTLAWIPEDKILDLALWDGDRVFLKKLLDHETEQFAVVLHYSRSGELIKVTERE
ncbi:MAG: 8-oxo-dGTP diphosphatase [Solobacterium sp.]|nr:8-oxo-dGTP diphosphatase [Solobacterium sp.]